MMKLKVNFKLPETECLEIKINNCTKTLYHYENFVEFDLPPKDNYILEVNRKPDKSNRRFLNVLLFLITIIFQGLFNIIIFNTNTKWINDIIPLCFKSKIIINMNCDTEINLIYTKSKLVNNVKVIPPHLYANGNEIKDIKYTINYYDFSNQYFNYVKRLASIFSIIFVLLLFLCFVAIKHNYIAITVFILLLLLGIILIIILISVTQYKKLKKLLLLFKSKEVNV